MLWVAPRCWIPTMTFKWCQCLHYQFTVLDHVIRASDFKNYDEMDWKICHIKLQSSVQYISFSSSINKRRHCRMRSWFSFFLSKPPISVTNIAPEMIWCGRVRYKTVHWHDIQYKIPHCHKTKHSHQSDASNATILPCLLFSNSWRQYDIEMFPPYWSFVKRIYRSVVDSIHNCPWICSCFHCC